jgi:hypothetical protein
VTDARPRFWAALTLPSPGGRGRDLRWSTRRCSCDAVHLCLSLRERADPCPHLLQAPPRRARDSRHGPAPRIQSGVKPPHSKASAAKAAGREDTHGQGSSACVFARFVHLCLSLRERADPCPHLLQAPPRRARDSPQGRAPGIQSGVKPPHSKASAAKAAGREDTRGQGSSACVFARFGVRRLDAALDASARAQRIVGEDEGRGLGRGA